jgi:hypothetical protein
MLNLTMLVSGSKIGGMVWLENSKEWPYFFSSIDDEVKVIYNGIHQCVAL